MKFGRCQLLYLLVILLMAFALGASTKFEEWVKPYEEIREMITELEAQPIIAQENFAENFDPQGIGAEHLRSFDSKLDGLKTKVNSLSLGGESLGEFIEQIWQVQSFTQPQWYHNDKDGTNHDNENGTKNSQNLLINPLAQIRIRMRNFGHQFNTIVVEHQLESMLNGRHWTMLNVKRLNKWIQKMLKFIASGPKTFCAVEPFKHAIHSISALQSGKSITEMMFNNAKVKEIVAKLMRDATFGIRSVKWVKPYQEIQAMVTDLVENEPIIAQENFGTLGISEEHLLNLESKLEGLKNQLQATMSCSNAYEPIIHVQNYCKQLRKRVDISGRQAVDQAYLDGLLAKILQTMRGYLHNFNTAVIKKELKTKKWPIDDVEKLGTKLDVLLSFIKQNANNCCDAAPFERAKAQILALHGEMLVKEKLVRIVRKLVLNAQFNILKNEFADVAKIAMFGTTLHIDVDGTSLVNCSEMWEEINYSAGKMPNDDDDGDIAKLRQQMLEWAEKQQPTMDKLMQMISNQLGTLLSHFDTLIWMDEADEWTILMPKYVAFCQTVVSTMQNVGMQSAEMYSLVDSIGTLFVDKNYKQLMAYFESLCQLLKKQMARFNRLSSI